MAKSAYSAQEKLELIIAHQNRKTSIKIFCEQNNITEDSLNNWIYLYQTYGMDGLQGSKGWKRYTKDVKTAAVLDYISGSYSMNEVVRKYEISSRSLLKQWIRNYNDHRELKEMKRMNNSMIKGRSTTLEERLEIVMYCIQNGENYRQASEHFNVSYQQVYQWVKKYVKEGEDGLQDKRGKRKAELELTPEVKIQRDMKRMEQENQRLRAEIAYLKKLEELERRCLKKRP
jgi:transposase